jgi:hypothetical protein
MLIHAHLYLVLVGQRLHLSLELLHRQATGETAFLQLGEVRLNLGVLIHQV